jgi:hypothetical protein
MSGDWRGILWTLLVTFCIVIIRCTETVDHPVFWWRFVSHAFNGKVEGPHLFVYPQLEVSSRGERSPFAAAPCSNLDFRLPRKILSRTSPEIFTQCCVLPGRWTIYLVFCIFHGLRTTVCCYLVHCVFYVCLKALHFEVRRSVMHIWFGNWEFLILLMQNPMYYAENVPVSPVNICTCIWGQENSICMHSVRYNDISHRAEWR